MEFSRFRIGLALIVVTLLFQNAVAAQESNVRDASPVASPATTPFPAGALGEQAAWTWSVLSANASSLTDAEIEQHLAPELLKQAPAAQIKAGVTQVQQTYGLFTIEPDSIVVSPTEPPAQLTYVIVGKDGTRLQVNISLDPTSGLLNGFLISPAPSIASPVASPLPAGITDTDVSFASDSDTLYGSFMTPAAFSAATKHPAALIISGSGPTDRDGNSPGLPLETNRNLAVTLADVGIPSLRYDKVGSGKTGLASHADGSGIDYQLFLQEVRDATAFLATQPGVDPHRIILVGHSEGTLFALVMAEEMVTAGTPPAALMLVSPLSTRYLDTIRAQLGVQTAAAVAAGTMTQATADATNSELDTVIDSLRTTGKLPGPISNPGLATIFTPANAPFLAQIDQVDPGDVASTLPQDLPVLVLLGEKDSQITPAEVQHLMQGFEDAGNTHATLVNLPNANHVLRIVEGTPNPSVDYRNPNLPFSPRAVTAIDDFLAQYKLT